MTAEEYFGDWMKVIDKTELIRVMQWLSSIDKSKLCPAYPNIFKAFKLCPLRDCRVVMLGQDLATFGKNYIVWKESFVV